MFFRYAERQSRDLEKKTFVKKEKKGNLPLWLLVFTVFTECGQLDMSTSSHSSVQCDVAVMTFRLARSPGKGLSGHHAAFLSQSLAVAYNDTAGAFRTRQSMQTDVQYLTVRHTHLHHRSTWVWWAAAWQRCTSFSPPHTAPQRLPWLPSLWSTCPWMHTHTHRENVKIESLCLSGAEIKRSLRGPRSQQQNERNSFTITELK